MFGVKNIQNLNKFLVLPKTDHTHIRLRGSMTAHKICDKSDFHVKREAMCGAACVLQYRFKVN